MVFQGADSVFNSLEVSLKQPNLLKRTPTESEIGADQAELLSGVHIERVIAIIQQGEGRPIRLGQPRRRLGGPPWNYPPAQEINIGILFKAGLDMPDPVRSHPNVVICECNDWRFRCRDSGVAPVRQSLLRFKEIFDSSSVLGCHSLNKRARPISGIIVHDQNFIGDIRWRLRQERSQGPRQQLASVISANNY